MTTNNNRKLIHAFAALADLGQEIADTGDFREMIRTSLHLLLGSLAIECGALAEFRVREQRLHFIAQRGFGGQQTRTRFELATLPEVQADLKLNDDQKKLAADQLAKQREKRAALVPAGGAGGGGGGGAGGAGFAAMQTEITKMNTELEAAFVAKLDDAQKSRMHGLIAQRAS